MHPPGLLTVWRVVPQPRVVQGPAVDSTASVLRGETNTDKKSQTRDFPGGPVAQGASLVAQTVENWPAMWESWVQSLGWEAPLEEGMTTHSSILAWRTPCIEEPGGVWSRVVKSPTGLNNFQWLRLCAPSAGGPDSIPGQRTRSHMLQLRVCMLQLRPSTAK